MFRLIPVAVDDGGGSSRKPENNEQSVPIEKTGVDMGTPTESVEPVNPAEVKPEDYELQFKTTLTDTLENASYYISAGLQDYIDAVIQIASIIPKSTSEPWDSAIVKETTDEVFADSIENAIQKYNISSSETGKVEELLNIINEEFREIYEKFGEYALDTAALVALVQNVLRDGLTDEEFDDLKKAIEEDSSINSIDELFSNEKVQSYAWFLARRGATTYVGKPAGSAGLQILGILAKEGYDGVANLPIGAQTAMLKNAFINYYKGAAAVAPSEIVAKSFLKSSLKGAAIYFAFSLLGDIITDNVTLEREIINVAKAGAIGVGTLVGSYVTAALTDIGTVGAGPIGAGVGVIVGVIGTIAVDTIAYYIKHASNDIPREYIPISVEDTKKNLAEQGYQIGAPKIEGMEEQSIFDFTRKLMQETNNEDFTYFIIGTIGNLPLLEPEKQEKYYSLYYSIAMSTQSSAEGFIYDMNNYLRPEKPLDAEEIAFIESFYSLFFINRFDRSPEYENILLTLNNTILYG